MEREEAASTHESLQRHRLRPAGDHREDARRLGAHDFTGGELWPEWEEALAGADARAFESLASAWGEPIPDLSALRHAFRLRALRAHHQRVRYMCLGPPASSEDVERWEARHGSLPRYTRAVLLETGTVHGYVDQECYSLSPDAEMFTPLGDPTSREFFMLDEGELDESLAALGHVLREFARGHQEPISTRGPTAEGPPARVAHLWSFFEGNHGDVALVLALAGPLADHLFEWSDFQHGGGPVARAGHIVDALYEGYFQGFLEFAFEDEEPDERLRPFGRHAASPLRLVIDGYLETE